MLGRQTTGQGARRRGEQGREGESGRETECRSGSWVVVTVGQRRARRGEDGDVSCEESKMIE